ncbi:MAG: PTS sugar transporter subunit IIA [Thermodesulfobacteriota bacterium]|nr:PTS sugar transporter subunit IIA [Thermodesulfobacteriota bacterium]
MKILDVLQKKAIITNLESRDKKGVLEELTIPASNISKIEHSKLVRMLMERERLGTTGIGGGIGIPHGKLKELESVILCTGLSRKGVDFEAMDNKPVYIFFLLFTPEGSTELHLMLLSRISKLLKNEIFKKRLLDAPDAEAVLSIIEEFDGEE